MYMSTIKATMITAAMATRGSFPATWSRNLHGKWLALGAAPEQRFR
jgi:hypothetical protein